MENTAKTDAINNTEFREIERKLKRIHVVIRKIQPLVPGSHELSKFDAYSNCLSWLHQLRAMYENDRQNFLEQINIADFIVNNGTNPISAADEEKITDVVGQIEDISE